MAQRFYITTPIYYINGPPHVGHAYSTIVADTIARYHRIRGHETYLLTGTDEHGQKIERVAHERGLSPKAYADSMSQLFKEAWPLLHIAYNDFIRTTEPRHEARVQELWRRVRDRGDIYLGEYEGWYCVADEAFYTEKELVHGLSPTGRPVERIREASYFFRLSRYTDVLMDFYERHPNFVQPESRFNEIKSFVRSGLHDLSISRTTFQWGVPVPDDPKHVMYVWFDALANYWTALGDEEGPLQRFWPADVHLVGKEIARFHAVFWPAFLLSAGFGESALPRQVYAHGWLTVNGEKMSKTAGNFLDPVQIANEVGADELRYYLLRAVVLGHDGDFSHTDLIARINAELANDLGNLLSRTLGLCSKFTDNKTPAIDEVTEEEQKLFGKALMVSGRASEALDAMAPHKALDAIWNLCRDSNRYVDEAKPWAVAKQNDFRRVGTILATLLESCRWLSLLIAPFLPEKSTQMRAQLGLPPITEAVGVDLWPLVWRPRPAGEPLALGASLFPRIDEDRQKEILARLMPSSSQTSGSQTPAPAAAPSTAAVQTDVHPAAPSPEAIHAISYEEFAKTDLRIGIVKSAEKIPKKDKLLDLRVDIGESEPRRIVAGLALSFKNPEELIGKRVIVVANLAPRDFGKGLISHGMLLAAGSTEALELATVGEQTPPGTRVKLPALAFYEASVPEASLT